MFLHSTFFFFIGLFMPSKWPAGTVVHLGALVLGRGVTKAPAGGCRANTVR